MQKQGCSQELTDLNELLHRLIDRKLIRQKSAERVEGILKLQERNLSFECLKFILNLDFLLLSFVMLDLI